MDEFQKPKTEYVKNKMKKVRYKDMGRIIHLFLLERAALKEIGVGSDSTFVSGVKRSYPRDYLMIAKELNPAEFKKFLFQIAFTEEKFRKMLKNEFPDEYPSFMKRYSREVMRMKKAIEKEKLEKKKEREDWVRFGGKP